MLFRSLSETIQAAADKIRDDVAKGKPDTVEAHCDVIDEAATNLLMACGFQDLTGQRINKVVNALTHLEGQIDGLFETLGISQAPAKAGLIPSRLTTKGPTPTCCPVLKTKAEASARPKSTPCSTEGLRLGVFPGHIGSPGIL